MKKMRNGLKHLQMDQQSMVIVLLVIMAQFQEHVLKMVQILFGVLFMVLVKVFNLF